MKFEYFFKIIVYLLWIFLLVLGIIELIEANYSYLWWFVYLAISIFIYFYFKGIPSHIHLLLLLPGVTYIFGDNLNLFFILPYYDKILHLVNPLIFGTLIYSAFKNRIKKNILIWFCVFASISLGVGWEIFEYFIDNNLNTITQGVFIITNSIGESSKVQIQDRLQDTMSDLIFDVIGAFLFAFLAYIFIWKKKK